MPTVEQEIYTGMLSKLVAANVITQYTADRLAAMLEEKKNGAKVKRHITDLLGLLTLLEH